MKRIITCGKCDKNFWLSFLAYFFISSLIFASHPKFPDNKSENEDSNKKFELTRPYLTYFGQLLMVFYELIYNKISHSETNILPNYNMKKKLIYFGFICFLLLLIDFYKISILLYFEKISFLNFIILYKSWTFVLLFLILINTFYFKINNYKHQKIAIFFFIIIGVFSLFLGIFSKSEITITDFFIIFFQMLSCSIEAITIILIKNIMDKKYYSPLKVCYLIGLINFIVISFIAFFIILIKNKDFDFIFGLSLLKKIGLFRFIIYFIFFSLIKK